MAGPAVIAEGDLPTEVDEGAAAADVSRDGPQSPLDLLRGKRPEMEKSLYLDLAVPRWEEVLGGRQLWVRYNPGNPAYFASSMEKREVNYRKAVKDGKHGDPDWMTKANADVLVAACVAVYDLASGEEPPKGDLPPGDYPTFSSPELSEALGASKSAVATVLKVYGTDGDVLIAVNQLMDWSAKASEEGDKSFLVN